MFNKSKPIYKQYSHQTTEMPSTVIRAAYISSSALHSCQRRPSLALVHASSRVAVEVAETGLTRERIAPQNASVHVRPKPGVSRQQPDMPLLHQSVQKGHLQMEEPCRKSGDATMEAFLALQQRVHSAKGQLHAVQEEKSILQKERRALSLAQRALVHSFARLHQQLHEERTARVTLRMRAEALKADTQGSRAEALEQAARAILNEELISMRYEASVLRAEIALRKSARK